MKIKGPIDEGRVFDGLYFGSNPVCCWYKRLETWKRPQWRKDHPDEFVPLSEIEPSDASERENDVKPSLKTPNPNPPATPANEKMLSTTRPIARPIEYRITKTEVLNRVKAALEAGESLRNIAERLAAAKEDFHASQREIGRALGRSASWVNRVLSWRQSGYKQSSPFGPTTRAARAVRRKGPGRCGGPKDADDYDQASLVPQCSPASQPASRPTAVNADLLGGPTQTDLVPINEARPTETQPLETETLPPLDNPARKPKRSASRAPEKQISSARKANSAQKLSPERMRIVLSALTKRPILVDAAVKAGIHPKTLASWLRRSEAGHDGYDIKWCGVRWRFHEACEFAIEEARNLLLGTACQLAMEATVKFDDDGNTIEEAVGSSNPKVMKSVLEWLRSETWAEPRKRNTRWTGGVIVLGQHPKASNKGWASSVRARQWKAIAARVDKIKP